MYKLMLSKVEAGRALGVSPSTIDRLISTGRIIACRIGRRVLIRRSEIEKLTGPTRAAVYDNNPMLYQRGVAANDGRPFSKV